MYPGANLHSISSDSLTRCSAASREMCVRPEQDAHDDDTPATAVDSISKPSSQQDISHHTYIPQPYDFYLQTNRPLTVSSTDTIIAQRHPPSGGAESILISPWYQVNGLFNSLESTTTSDMEIWAPELAVLEVQQNCKFTSHSSIVVRVARAGLFTVPHSTLALSKGH